MDDVKNEIAREPYEAPTIEDVPVRPEEQLLAGCKLATSSGPGGIFCLGAPCSTAALS